MDNNCSLSEVVNSLDTSVSLGKSDRKEEEGIFPKTKTINKANLSQSFHFVFNTGADGFPEFFLH